MNFTMKEIVNFAADNDVRFVRLAFCDLKGTFRCLSIMPTELPRAFDTGISIDGSALKGFSDVSASDLFLRPDPSTMALLPSEDGYNVLRFICDVYTPFGMPFPFDTRKTLKRVIDMAYKKGYTIKIGAESEFYLFEKTSDGNIKPIDRAGYLDMPPFDKGESIRKEICLLLEEMSMYPETSHHEQGPGQNEIDFRYSDALSAADNYLSFRQAVMSVAESHDLKADFSPKPLSDAAGNGLHVNISLFKDGENVFDIANKDDSKYFMAGILDNALPLTSFINPTTSSYARLGSFEAPKVVAWSHNNRSAYVRIPSSNSLGSRMELRAADGAVNPYLAFSAIILAGLDGIEKKTPLMAESKENMYERNEGLTVLPSSLAEAVAITSQSALFKAGLGETLVNKYLSLIGC